MPFYKVPAAQSVNSEASKGSGAAPEGPTGGPRAATGPPLRSTPEFPSSTMDSSSSSGSVGSGGGGGGGGGGVMSDEDSGFVDWRGWSRAMELDQNTGLKNYPPHHHTSTDSTGSRYVSNSFGARQMSIVEREIEQQNEREAELLAQRQSLYRHPCSPLHQNSRSASAAESDQPLHVEPMLADHRPRFSPGERGHHRPQKTHPASSSSSSSASSPPPASVRRISYEEAIACPSHPGESLIAREIEELKRREEELRQSRRQQQGQPKGQPKGHSPLQLRESSVDGDDDDDDHGPSSSPSTGSDLDADRARVRVPSIGVPAERLSRRRSRGERIHPLDGPTTEEVAAKFLPEEGETPIEREVRRLKEKEAALRQERGLPVDDAEGRGAIVEVAGEGVRPFDQRTDQTMKRLASSLLLVEIEKEQQREMELRLHSQQTATTASVESARSPSAAKTIHPSYNRRF